MSTINKLKKYIFGKKDLSDKDVKGLLISFSIPSILAIIVNGLYSVIDSIFVGRGVGEVAIGAIAIIQPFIGIIITLGTVISTGAMSVLSRSLGENDNEKAKICFGNSMTLISTMSILVCIIGTIFLNPILRIMGAEGEIFILGRQYMRIILVGMIFMAPSFLFGQLLRAEGKAKESMVILVIGSISNIILDYIFIIVFKGGATGAALATTIAYFLSFLYALFMMAKFSSVFVLKIKYLRLKVSIIKEMLSIGISSFISQGAGNVATIVANNVMVQVGGERLITSIGIFAIIQNFVFMPISGITQSMQPIIGYNYGRGNLEKIKETVKLTLKYVFIVALVNSIIVMLFTAPIVRLFIKGDSEVLAYSVPYIRLGIIFACFGAQQWVGGTVFRSLGMAKRAYFFAVLRMIIIFMPSMIILGNTIGELGCWISYTLADLLSGLVSKRYILRFLNKLEMDKVEKLQCEGKEA
ncbi:MATE family efflux transporter [Clostridium paraputrificum]|uniref:MATE family efflux transporter n=1 Tax=Clostridium TaxID=1485 RepID=UPI00232F3E21|nr:MULTISPECIES: MATE family efflux transporter [Clostridium]MDB2104212.1 MATE family efflux transporter [Clostridium paraputrificum]MDU1937236.1 MATE family efflux transporter [Clostridium sp.]MDU2045867.1 MATE family efflux transporter [Clostridium sp.]